MAKIEPRYWRQMKRHPLSAEYPDLTGRAREIMAENVRRHGVLNKRKVMLLDNQVIDGWQLYTACLQADVKPEFDLLKLPPGMTAEQWVSTVNDLRRHETQEKAMARVEQRCERVAQARAAGMSQRAIAEQEGVSKVQVQRDLEEASSGGPGGPPEKPSQTLGFQTFLKNPNVSEGGQVDPPVHLETVTGKDGKTYSARPTLLCDRCQRLGAIDGCNACKEARKLAKKPKQAPKQSDPLKDAFGNDIPQRCRDAWGDPWLQNTFDFLAMTLEAVRKERLGNGMQKRAKHYPSIDAKEVIDSMAQIDNTLDKLVQHFRTQRPAGVCPPCGGSGCEKCQMKGLVPRDLYLQLAKEKS